MQSPNDGLTYAERAALGGTAGDKARGGALVGLPPESALDRRSGVQTVGDMLPLVTWATANDRQARGELEASAWLEILRGHDSGEIKRAITAHARHSRYPVTAADLVEILEEGP